MAMSNSSLTPEKAVRALGRLLIGTSEEHFYQIIEQDLTPQKFINFMRLTSDPVRREIYHLIQVRYDFEPAIEIDPLLKSSTKLTDAEQKRLSHLLTRRQSC